MTWYQLEQQTLHMIEQYTEDRNIDCRSLLKMVTIAAIAHDKAKDEKGA